MSEIEKTYENAGVKYYKEICAIKNVIDKVGNKECYFEVCCSSCPLNKTSFTAEKQIAIIKLISKQGQVIIENWEKDNRGFNVTFRANSNLRYITMDCITRKTVEEALAQIVNDVWQDLTEEEKQQVKGILE